VALPPLALLGSTALHVSTGEIYKIALYTVFGLVALPGFYFLLTNSNLSARGIADQAAYLETITGSVISDRPYPRQGPANN